MTGVLQNSKVGEEHNFEHLCLLREVESVSYTVAEPVQKGFITIFDFFRLLSTALVSSKSLSSFSSAFSLCNHLNAYD